MSDHLFFVGTYSQRGSKGIYAVRVASATGVMTIVGDTPANNASFLCLSPDAKYLFAVSETGERPDGKRGGAVTSFAVQGTSLKQLSEQPVEGAYTCHVACSPNGKWLVASNYGDGTHAVVPVGANGTLGKPTDIVTNAGAPGPNQKSGHAHSATFSSDGKFAYACDLGLDRVCVYRLDDKSGKLTLASAAVLPPGAGPRHFAVHPKLATAYAINELNSTITAFTRNPSTGALSAKQTVETLPGEVEAERRAGSRKNSCADIHLSANGRTLYGSNRGHDSVAVFAVDERTGQLTATGHVSTGGKNPRNFSLIPKTPLLLAANQDGDNILAFRHSDTAGNVPKPTGATLAVPAPVCILPVP
ncbi:MAG: lactonase family protein [Fibrella sp.]|nr:lactonase family protein [Armatimonadota bacterium]